MRHSFVQVSVSAFLLLFCITGLASAQIDITLVNAKNPKETLELKADKTFLCTLTNKTVKGTVVDDPAKEEITFCSPDLPGGEMKARLASSGIQGAFGVDQFSFSADDLKVILPIARAKSCLSNQKAIESLVSLWEAKNLELEAGPNKFADIDTNGTMVWGSNTLSLNDVAKDQKLFICPEALETSGTSTTKPCYRFYCTDNSGGWILGSTESMGGRGVVCIHESQGRLIGKSTENGPDNTKASAHHYW